MKSKWEDIPPSVRELIIKEQYIQTGTSDIERISKNTTVMAIPGKGGFDWNKCSLGKFGTGLRNYYFAWSMAIMSQDYTQLEKIYSISVEKPIQEVEIEGEKFMV